MARLNSLIFSFAVKPIILLIPSELRSLFIVANVGIAITST